MRTKKIYLKQKPENNSIKIKKKFNYFFLDLKQKLLVSFDAETNHINDWKSLKRNNIPTKK